MTKSKSWRDVLPIHPAAELFPLMSVDERRELGEDIKRNGLTSPVVLWRPHFESPPCLLDGRSRLDGIETTGRQVRVEVVGATKTGEQWALRVDDKRISNSVIVLSHSVDPYTYVISANIHRRHLTAEQKRDLIAKLIKAQPKKSNRQIAKTAGVSHPHVAKVRGDLERSGDVETVTTSIDTKGRKQPAKKPKTKVERNRKARERRAEKRNQKWEAEAKAAERKEAEAKAKATQLAADLIKANLAERVLDYLTWQDDQSLLDDALKRLLGAPAPKKRGRPPGSRNKPKSPPAEAAPPQRGGENGPDPETGAEIMKAKFAALDDGADSGPMPEFPRRS